MTISSDAPFRDHVAPRRLPRPFREAPPLPRSSRAPRAKTALLINPFYPKDPHASFGKHVLTPTLALTSVAASTPPDWHVAYHDENLLDGAAPADPPPAVVGITVHLTFAERAFALARAYRAMGSQVVLGGLHVISCPDECAAHADALAIGDGVALWGRILEDAARGELAPRYEQDFRTDYAADPAPRRDLLKRRSYLTTTSLNATRGCHNRCGFCYLATDGLRMPYRMRDPQQIAAEIRADGQPYVVFTDNNLGSSKRYLHALCAALEPLRIIWSAAVTIDVTDDPSLVRAMAVSGCTGVFIGFESLSNDNLVDARKKTPRTEDYARRVRLLHDYGIQVNGSFVLGFDHDDDSCFAQLANWVEHNRLENATYHILTPYPNTPLFRQLEEQGRILHRDWSKYDTAHVVFRPKKMSPERLQRGYEWLYQRTFGHRSIWNRRPDDARAVPPYLLMAYLYKRSNPLWRMLIERDLTQWAWRPLVEWTRLRHVQRRAEIAARPIEGACARKVRLPTVVYASV